MLGGNGGLSGPRYRFWVSVSLRSLLPDPLAIGIPPISYILGYVCTLGELNPFGPNDEASERAILPFSEAESLDSIKANAKFYSEALRRCNVDRRK